MREGDLLALIDSFYEAALDESAWPIVLTGFAHAFGGPGATMINLSADPPLLSTATALEEGVAAYQALWWQKDSFLKYVRRAQFGPGIYVDSDHLNLDTRARDEFYQDFLRPLGIEGTISIISAPLETMRLSISVHRRVGIGPMQSEERRHFALVARHLSRAAAIGLRLSTSKGVQEVLARRLSEFDCAVAVVGRDGRLLLSNQAFDALHDEGVTIRHGRVTLPRPEQQGTLDALIRRTLHGTLGDPGPDTLAVARPGNLLPLLIRAVPITPERAERFIGPIPARAVMLMVLNPSHSAYPKLTTALQALGLTPAQARIALAVGSGQSPREAAEALQISEATVRTTIKHLYGRLGIDRQSQLARLVSRAIPFSL